MQGPSHLYDWGEVVPTTWVHLNFVTVKSPLSMRGKWPLGESILNKAD